MNNNLLASRHHKLPVVLIGILLLSLPVTSVWAKGEATNIYTSSGNAGTQAQYTGAVDNNLYRWGQGSDGQGMNGNLFIDGFSLANGKYDYQSSAGVVKIIRSNGDTSCGLFAETTGVAFNYQPDFPGDIDGKGCDMVRVMEGRIINIGMLDAFNNVGGEAKSIERIDFIFNNGIIVAPQTSGVTGHIVTEKSGNNRVKIAAITALDGLGNPSEYGDLLTVYAGGSGCLDPVNDICYGTPAGNRNYEFLHTADASVPLEKVGSYSEPLGLAFVSQDDLGLVQGTTYYGFSYFAPDVDPVNNNLHILTDPDTFPADTDKVSGTGDADIFGGTAGYFVLESLIKSVSGDLVDAVNNGIKNVTVQLYRDNGSTPNVYDTADTLIDSVETDFYGVYSFSRVLVGDYIIRVDSADSDLTGLGYTASTESLAVTVSSDLFGQRFNFALPQITGSVFSDMDADGVNDAGEGVSNVAVRLFSDAAMNNQVGADVLTDGDGLFTFSGIAHGMYYLFLDQGNSPALNGLVGSTNNPLSVVVQNSTDVTTSFPFVAVAPVTYSLSGTVFQDENGDGLLAGSGEPGIRAITVTLYDSNMAQAGATDTDTNGTYAFNNIVAGDYTVQIDSSGGPAVYAISSFDNSEAVTLSANKVVNFPFRIDTDSDGIPDINDIDDDNDGILDSVEQNGTRDVDTDGDGVSDRLDLDSDNDGILDAVESGATGVTIDQGRISGSAGANGLPDVVESGNESGNTTYTLLDTDGDAKPDFRDLDSDNDGISDVFEAGGTDPDGNGFVGVGDPLTLSGGGVNNSGIPFVADNTVILTPPNSDGDTVPDYRDLDSDNDGISDVVEAGGEDGEPNGYVGMGSPPVVNALGIPAAGLIAVPTDSDADGLPDFVELDSDNDGIKDIIEVGYTDENGNGRLDGFSDPDGDGSGNPVGFTSAADFPDVDFDGLPDYQDKVSQPPKLETGLDGMGCTLSDNRSVDPVFPLLILLASLYLLRGRFLKGSNKKKKKKLAVKGLGVMIVGIMLVFPVTLFADENTEFQSRWYGGLGIGLSELKPDPNNTSFTIEESRSQGGKLFLGYDLFKRFSVEAYYSDVGEAEVGSTYPGISSGTIGYKDYGISALYYVLKQHEAHEGFGLFGRVGLGRMKNNTELPYERLNDNHAMLGAGLEYAFNNGFALRAELDYYDTDSRLFALSLMKRFGGSQQEKPEPLVLEPEPAPVAAIAASAVAEPKVEPIPATIVKVAKLGELGTVYFDSDSFALTATARATLDDVAAELLRVLKTKVEVQGYTDNRASNIYNQLLSLKRAHAVVGYLDSKGVAYSRMKPMDFGEKNPVASNKSVEGRKLNRRVEFHVIEK